MQQFNQIEHKFKSTLFIYDSTHKKIPENNRRNKLLAGKHPWDR